MKQFNIYKYNDLIESYKNMAIGIDTKSIEIGYQIIEEWCWTGSKTELFKEWERQYQQPHQTLSNLTLLHYNIRSFDRNKSDLIDIIEKFKPEIISINELGKKIPIQVIAKILFSYDVFKAEGTNKRGGTIIAIDKQLKAIPIDCQKKIKLDRCVCVNK